MKHMKLHQYARAQGFSLIELLIVIAVIGILAAIAVPSYNRYVLRSHRAEAKNMLMATAQRLEQNYTLSGSYAQTQGSAVNDIINATIIAWGFGQEPLNGPARYNLTFAANNPTANTFVLLATPVGGQAADTCGVLLLDNRNLKGANGQNNRHQITRECWDR
jgi:type IV pilus assembly protein PilE